MSKKNSSKDYIEIDDSIRVLKEKIANNPKNIGYIFLRIIRYSYESLIVNKNYKIVIKFRDFLNWVYFKFLKLYSDLRKKPIFYVVGDSHVREYYRKIPFVACHLGAITAYNLVNKKSTTESNKKLFAIIKSIDKKRDYVILSAGEIDARVHLNKALVMGKGKFDIDKLVKKTVTRYLQVINQLKKQGYSILVLGIVPVTTRANHFNIKHFASTSKRIQMYKKFNKELSSACAYHKIVYLNLYDATVGKDGFALPEYYFDGVHLNKKVVTLTKKLLRENGLL